MRQEAAEDGADRPWGVIAARDDLDADVRRMALARRAVGPDVRIAIDANQRWDVDDAVAWVKALAEFDPWWGGRG